MDWSAGKWRKPKFPGDLSKKTPSGCFHYEAVRMPGSSNVPIDSTAVNMFFLEMGEALNKTFPFTPQDILTYRELLDRIDACLDEYIDFTKKASAPVEKFEQQKQDLAKRKSFIDNLVKLYQDGKAWLGGEDGKQDTKIQITTVKDYLPDTNTDAPPVTRPV